MKFDRDSLLNVNSLLALDKESCGILELYNGTYFFLDDPSAVATRSSCAIKEPTWAREERVARFHTHLAKPYPSYADILSTVRRARTEVIVTKWGVWVLTAVGEPRDVQSSPRTIKTYDYYSYLLYKNRGFDVSLDAINAFCTHVPYRFNREYGSSLSVSFSPWESLTSDERVPYE